MRQPDPRARRTPPLGRERRAAVEPGLEYGAADHEPGDLVLVQRQQHGGPNGSRWGRRASRTLRAGAPVRCQDAVGTPRCARSSSRSSFTGGVGPHGAAPYDYDPLNPNPTKFPPYWDGAFIVGEFTQDTLREVRLDSQNRVFKINNTLPCGPVPATPTRPWLCDNPMDMEFGPDGTFYLLTYGDGFFAINPDAGMMRWEYVKGQRAPVVGR